MYIETLYANSLEELERLVDEFTTGRIICGVNCRKVGMSWQADIFYYDITDTNNNIK